MIKFIMMSSGYVENNTTSWLIYSTITGEEFNTKEEALRELALDLYAKYRDDVLKPMSPARACCTPFVDNREFAYCPKCGRMLENKRFSRESFIYFIHGLHGTTCDSYGESEWSDGREFVWWPWRAEDILKAEREEIVLIPENAEIEMYNILMEAKPELKNHD